MSRNFEESKIYVDMLEYNFSSIVLSERLITLTLNNIIMNTHLDDTNKEAVWVSYKLMHEFDKQYFECIFVEINKTVFVIKCNIYNIMYVYI